MVYVLNKFLSLGFTFDPTSSHVLGGLTVHPLIFSIPQVIHQVGEADTQRVVVHTWCMKLEDHLPDYEY